MRLWQTSTLFDRGILNLRPTSKRGITLYHARRLIRLVRSHSKSRVEFSTSLEGHADMEKGMEITLNGRN